MKKILVVGSSNTDLIIKVPEIPRPGETLLGGVFQTFPGGKGANQAVAAARAGGDVVFIASVGDDTYGAEAVKGYKLDNINTENIKICKEIPSGIAMITVSHKGENAITVASGANSVLTSADLDDAEKQELDNIFKEELNIAEDQVEEFAERTNFLVTALAEYITYLAKIKG